MKHWSNGKGQATGPTVRLKQVAKDVASQRLKEHACGRVGWSASLGWIQHDGFQLAILECLTVSSRCRYDR